MYEVKQLPQFQTKEVNGRTVTGIFAVHGNVDDGGDRSLAGSFDNIKVKGRDRVRFLWQHNSSEPPVATVDDIHEVGRKDLPPAVLAYAPEAMGGVEITRTYLDTPRGNEILAGIKAGAIDEMSYAYDATNATYEDVDGKQIRNIHEVKLYDASDVNWGMNPATVAAKTGIPQAGMPFQVHSATVLAAVEEFIDRARGLSDLRAKEGRQFSSANVARLQGLYDALAAAASDLKTLLDATAPPKTADPSAVQKALMEFQRLQAQLNGVSL
jgi:HK97 family phage prohead protease